MKKAAKTTKKAAVKDLPAKKSPKGGFIGSFDPQPEPPGKISLSSLAGRTSTR